MENQAGNVLWIGKEKAIQKDIPILADEALSELWFLNSSSLEHKPHKEQWPHGRNYMVSRPTNYASIQMYIKVVMGPL